jgi:hypothetical protein
MMSPQPTANYVFTSHARFEMGRRGLSEDVIRLVLETPAQRWEVRPGRELLQWVLSVGDPPKDYVIRVIVDVDRTPNEVVTAYRTSKIGKYWRQEP